MSKEKELGLKTILAVKSELGIDLENNLLEDCFEIQKKYQFSHDRALSTKAMETLIESQVEKLCDMNEEEGA